MLTLHSRKLTSIEQAMELLNRRASSYYVVTVCYITGPLSEEIVRQALDLIQHRHPRLNSRIVGELDSLRFEGGGIKIPLRVVNKLHSEQWKEVALQELNQKIESDKSLMRAVLVQIKNENNANYLITTIHHAISDGSSCIQLHAEILTYCQKIASGEPINQVTSLPPLPPLQELLPESMQGSRGVLNASLFLLRAWFKQIWHQPETLGFEKYVPIELRRCGMVHRKLSQELTADLIGVCRKEKTTVQGALCAAMMFEVARKISDGKRTNVCVNCRSAINLHKRFNPVISDENMGVLASSFISFHTLRTNTSFWDLARDVRQQLETGLESDDIFSPVLISKKVFESLLAHPRKVSVTVGITNIGRVNIPQVYGPFQLEEISGVVAPTASGGVFAAAVSTFQGKMLLNFMFSEPSISQETVEILASKVVRCFVDACKNEKLTFAL